MLRKEDCSNDLCVLKSVGNLMTNAKFCKLCKNKKFL